MYTETLFLPASLAARDLNRGLLGPALSSSSSQEERTEAIASAKQVARYLVENVLQGVPKSDSEAAYREFLIARRIHKHQLLTLSMPFPPRFHVICRMPTIWLTRHPS